MISRVEKKLLHYGGKAIATYNMIQADDRVLLCLSGGKDSFALIRIMQLLKTRAKINFTLHVLSLNKGWPGWNGEEIAAWLATNNLSFTILNTTIAQTVNLKQRPGCSPCALCSRLRRGHIYSFAKKHGYHKVALGHHRDDLIVTLLMSLCYGGTISSMPPKLLTTDKKLIVIRPLVFCQEKDIISYAEEQNFPLAPSDICPTKSNSSRVQISKLIQTLAQQNPKIPSNLLRALANVKASQLMDSKLWNFKELENLIQN